MDSLKTQIDLKNIPNHIAVIMDGNGRWAKSKGMPRVYGHQNGVKSVREINEAAAELGVNYLTLYAFSTENWNRPKMEVSALMTLLVQTLDKEVETLQKNNIKLQMIGDLSRLPEKTRSKLLHAIDQTKNNTRMTLILALNYSARQELSMATKNIAKMIKHGELDPNDITEQTITNHLYTQDIPDPELLIRTSGEMRVSNFLLWQLAYTEFCFLDIHWPDFRKENLYEAIINFQNRERRFGMTSEQL